MVRFALRRIISGILVLLLIGYVSFFAQDMAQNSRNNAPASFLSIAKQALDDCVNLAKGVLRGDLGTYSTVAGTWSYLREQRIGELWWPYLLRSLSLLIGAMLLGTALGGIIGLVAATQRRNGVSLLVMLLSILGVSTPSFFLGMLLQYLEILLYRNTGIQLLPVGGFGWDRHIVMPMLVLAARPTAQMARLCYARFSDILVQDYVRTGHAKGLRAVRLWRKHIVPNAANTILTSMGTSLRFSLSSLPVVEFLFGWPGMGRAMLDMLRTYQKMGGTVLALTLGGLFITTNIVLDVAYRIIDPRLRESETNVRLGNSWLDWILTTLRGFWQRITFNWLRKRNEEPGLPPLPETSKRAKVPTADEPAQLRSRSALSDARRVLTGNPALVLGSLMAICFIVLVVAGPALARHDVYSSSLTVSVKGEELLPPVPPSPGYALGTDAQGRDILSLILVGARRTLSIAFFAVAARLLVGGALGFVAGWFAGSRLDDAIMALAEAMAAFPSLLLAMLIVYAIGIKQGLTAFVAALAVIGWGEVMQAVRGRVMAIKPMAYVESAIATGLTPGQILSAHVLPNVWPTMVSLSFLEMGGVLMVLGELGFLGVFIGGGFAASGDGTPQIIYYDIPEWSVMLANSWRTFRSYPWSSLYPALAFFLAILGFTLLGEGLRWLSERVTLSLRSFFNRYTLAVGVLLIFGVNRLFSSTSLYARYTESAKGFDAQRAMEDVRHLTDERFNGRLSGTQDADEAAAWIAEQFETVGLQPAGERTESYYDDVVAYYRNLTETPSLTFVGPDGERVVAEYGKDFIRYPGPYDTGGSSSGELVLAYRGSDRYYSSSALASEFGLTENEFENSERVLLELTPDDISSSLFISNGGTLCVHDGAFDSPRYELLTHSSLTVGESRPGLWVRSGFLEEILAQQRIALKDLYDIVSNEAPAYVRTGWRVEIDVPYEEQAQVTSRNVVGIWPGTDIVLDNEFIIIAAYYDGLGRAPDGTLYPGANDNASGVAAMLEIVRTLKEADYRPKRTILFVAWSGGERHNSVNYERLLSSREAFARKAELVAGFELEGIAAGTGNSAVIWHSTRQRITSLLRDAAKRVDTPVTTRAAGLHADTNLWAPPSEDVPSATISWAGADDLAHLPTDTAANLDPDKMAQVGRMTSLALMVLAGDTSY